MGWIISYQLCVCKYTGVEGCRGNLEARRVRNAENEDDVEGVSKIVYFVITTINIANGLCNNVSRITNQIIIIVACMYRVSDVCPLCCIVYSNLYRQSCPGSSVDSALA